VADNGAIGASLDYYKGPCHSIKSRRGRGAKSPGLLGRARAPHCHARGPHASFLCLCVCVRLCVCVGVGVGVGVGVSVGVGVGVGVSVSVSASVCVCVSVCVRACV